MKLQELLKLAQYCDNFNQHFVSDQLDNQLIKFAQTNSMPTNTDIPMSVRVVPWEEMDDEFKAIEEERQNFPRFTGTYYGGSEMKDDDSPESVFDMNGGQTTGFSAIEYDPKSVGMNNVEEFTWDKVRKTPTYKNLVPK